MRNLNLTLLQIDLRWQDPDANRQAIEQQISAVAGSSDLVVLPETFTTGYTMEAAAMAETHDGKTSTWLRELATEHHTDICGSVIIVDGNRYFNRLLWAGSDGQMQSYDKRHLFRTGGEHDKFTPGRERLIVEIGGWRVCPMICYDLRFPVWARNRGDYDLLLYVANWPSSRRSAWETLLPARAVENLCYVAGVNRVGTDGNGVECAGGSMVADYLGHKLALADDQPTALAAELSMEKLLRYREKFMAWKDADEFVLETEPPA